MPSKLFNDLNQSIASLKHAVSGERVRATKLFPYIENLEQSAASLQDRVIDFTAQPTDLATEGLMLALNNWYRSGDKYYLEKVREEYRAYHLNEFGVTP